MLKDYLKRRIRGEAPAELRAWLGSQDGSSEIVAKSIGEEYGSL